jgi:hypothetical protein
LRDAKPGEKTNGRTTQFVKQGEFSQASKEFDSQNSSGIKDINTDYGAGRTGTFSGDRTITVRLGSTDGCPTLEIRNPVNNRGIDI